MDPEKVFDAVRNAFGEAASAILRRVVAENMDDDLLNLMRLELKHALEACENERNRDLTATLLELRSDSDVLDVYKGRIVDLQKVINGTKLPGEIDAAIGRQTLRVPVGVDTTAGVRDREALLDLGRLAGRYRQDLQQSKSESAALTAQVGALLSENAMLMDRVAVLEQQLAVAGRTVTSSVRELEKTRGALAGRVLLNGTEVEPEVAMWLIDVYKMLQAGADTQTALKSLAGRSQQKTTRTVDSREKLDKPSPFVQRVVEQRSQKTL